MNKKIKEYAKKHNVKLWQVADAIGLTDGNFSRKLRKEFSEEETERVLAIIDELSAEQDGDI